MSGLLTAAVFTFFSTGLEYFYMFIGPVVLIGFISALVGLLTKGIKAPWYILIGSFTAFVCCALVVLAAVSHI